jgi:mono/diheme cytochrome c family protein
MVLLLFGITVRRADGAGMQQPENIETKSGNANLIARGKYLVEGVAGCGDCHTPRRADGTPDRSRWLAGAPLFLQPAKPVPGWPIVAPRLAGLLPGEEAEIVKLLMTGVWRDGKHLRPPMPRFQMNRDDAEAIVAYLKSL